MQKIFKNIIRAKPYSIFLDCLGAFSLSSFLLLWLFWGFIVEITPMCGFYNALIISVDCEGYFGGALSFYFNLFSPVAISIGMLSVVALFNFHFLSLFYIGIALTVIILTFRIVYKFLQTLIVERNKFSRKNRMIMAGLGFLVISPALLVTGLKFQIAPPVWSNRMVKIHMWHNELVIPRAHLKRWSLVEVERSEKKTLVRANFGLGRFKNSSPYIRLRVPFDEMVPSAKQNENTEINMRSHPYVWSDSELFEQREKQLKKRIDKVYHKDKELIYKSLKREGDWEVHEARASVGGRKPDAYVLRDSNRNITHLLECTPKTYCEAYNFSKDRWKSSKCKNPEDCINCARRCTDSSGTNEYSLYYKLDKKYIREYVDVRASILGFVDEYKKSSRFVLSKESVDDWSEVNDGISIKMTEEAGRAFYVLTRNNVNKPLEFYIGDILLSAATVREPIGDGRMIFMLEGGIRDKAISFLEKE